MSRHILSNACQFKFGAFSSEVSGKDLAMIEFSETDNEMTEFNFNFARRLRRNL